MKNKISNQYLRNFIVIFLITVLATVLSFILLSAASSLISGSLAKNRYTASSIIKEDYRDIDTTDIVNNGGGVQIVDKDYNVIFSAGLDTLEKDEFTVQEFTAFLTDSKSKAYNYDVLYDENGEFWLIVTFPTSIRLDFRLIHNQNASLNELLQSGGIFAFVIIIYLLVVAMASFLYSRVSAAEITIPLKKLTNGTRLLREGDYSARVDLKLKNEFAELQNTFNDMADRIEHEISLRKKSEEDRKKLILDISHDLKNPLSSIQGYAEHLSQKIDSPELKIIHQNSIRANQLLNDLFELSKMDSPEFTLKLNKVDICELLRQICGELIPLIESNEFGYEFDIPETSIYVDIDEKHFRRVIQNLTDNALRYSPKGTVISVSLNTQDDMIIIVYSDNGVGIPKHLAKDIFKPFVRNDDSRNSKSGGSGLGLSIAQKIMKAHKGDLTLCDEGSKGSTFKIILPKI